MFEKAYKDLIDVLNTGDETVMLTFLTKDEKGNGAVLEKKLSQKSNFFLTESQKARETGDLQLINPSDEQMVLFEPFFPKPRLIIFGGGHIAKPLADFGSKVGFSIAVVDDRPSFANPLRFPEASQVICDSFENSFKTLNPNKSDFVVIVTRGHRHDETCLRKTLEYNPAYVGMIGSKRRVRAMKDKLLAEGYKKNQMDSVHSPIGLDIGAVTPEEIAVSIIAQVIGCRRSRGNWPECDIEVLREAARESTEPRAMVTIISSKGSVPRKAGAKMLVWPDGRTLGSIGGGCSEAAVITVARELAQNQGYTLQHVDMTGDVAEDEGMVCGGTMEVLIESL